MNIFHILPPPPPDRQPPFAHLHHAGSIVPLSPGQTILIGRTSECDVCIAELKVSRRHVKIEWGGHGFMLFDLGSSNGTTVNGMGIPTEGYALQDGDRIVLGGTYALHYERLADDATPSLPVDTGNPPQMMDAPAGVDTMRGPYLRVMAGVDAGRAFPLWGDRVTIGHGEDCEIRLGDDKVRSRQACVDSDAGILVLRALPGVTVNGEPLAVDGYALRDGDQIGMGDTILVFYDHAEL